MTEETLALSLTVSRTLTFWQTNLVCNLFSFVPCCHWQPSGELLEEDVLIFKLSY